jgi:hypothetical protein
MVLSPLSESLALNLKLWVPGRVSLRCQCTAGQRGPGRGTATRTLTATVTVTDSKTCDLNTATVSGSSSLN